MRVYLAGPITGHPTEEVKNWRNFVREQVQVAEFIDPALLPFDATDAYKARETASKALRRLNHGRLVLTRNRILIENSDIIFANFLGAKHRVSIGVVGELFWANSFNKPIIIIREKRSNIHDHAMLNAMASRICYSLEEGCELLGEMLVTPSSLARAVAS
jgi:hypothetical protein